LQILTALKYAVSKKAKAGVAHAFEVVDAHDRILAFQMNSFFYILQPWVLALPRTLSPPVALSPPQCVWKFKHRPSVATVPTSPASSALRLNRDRMLNFADERQKRRRRSKRIQVDALNFLAHAFLAILNYPPCHLSTLHPDRWRAPLILTYSSRF